MSDQHPPQDPSGQPPGWGQQQPGQPGQPGQPAQQPGWGQQPGQPTPPPPPAYGQQPAYGQPQAGMPAGGYAPWAKRVGAYLIDLVVMAVGYIPALIGLAIGGGLGGLLVVIGYLCAIAIFVWNICFQGGNTGYTIGKGVMGIKLISEQTGQPIGAGMAFVRTLAHIIDGIPCYIGYLWPLWDAKRQTFADKILTTVVIEQPQN